MHLPWLDPDPNAPFPPVERAHDEPDGLLAAGGDLSVPRLRNAYAHGIFPWYSQGQPILWWSPDPRMLFRTDRVRLSSRFRRRLRQLDWQVRADGDFATVIDACARMPRPGQRGTWITPAMRDAYTRLHQAGDAHSIEVYEGDMLVGGLYGVAIGRMFFGESMVSLASGGSKAALAALAMRLRQWGWPLIDAQVESAHLLTLGAELWSRRDFMAEVARLGALPGRAGSWRDGFGVVEVRELAAAAV